MPPRHSGRAAEVQQQGHCRSKHAVMYTFQTRFLARCTRIVGVFTDTSCFYVLQEEYFMTTNRLSQLLDQLRRGELDRRQFLHYAAAPGISASAATLMARSTIAVSP